MRKATLIFALALSGLLFSSCALMVDTPVPSGATVKNAAEVTSSEETVYFCRAGDMFLCRIAANGSNERVVVPYPVKDFVVAANEQSFVFRGPDDSLSYYRSGATQPVLVCRSSGDCLMCSVDISADNRRIAYAAGDRVKVFDVQTGETVTSTPVGVGRKLAESEVSWDRTNPELLYCRAGFGEGEWTFKWNVVSDQPAKIWPRSVGPLGRSFRRCGAWTWGGDLVRRCQPPWDTIQGEYDLRAYPGGSLGGLSVRKGGEQLSEIRPPWPLSGLRSIWDWGPDHAAFLSESGIVVCEFNGQIYVFDGKVGKLAKLTAGRNFVIANERFQMELNPPDQPAVFRLAAAKVLADASTASTSAVPQADRLVFKNIGFSIAPLDESWRGELSKIVLNMYLPGGGGVEVSAWKYSGTPEELAEAMRKHRSYSSLPITSCEIEGNTLRIERTFGYERHVLKDGMDYVASATWVGNALKEHSSALRAYVDSLEVPAATGSSEKLVFGRGAFSIAPVDVPGKNGENRVLEMHMPGKYASPGILVTTEPFVGTIVEYQARCERERTKKTYQIVSSRVEGNTLVMEYASPSRILPRSYYERAVLKDGLVYLATASAEGEATSDVALCARMKACVDSLRPVLSAEEMKAAK